MARMPRPPQPTNHIDALQDIAWDLRDLNLPGIAGDVEAVRECLVIILDLTRHGDCLFGDELRNILGVRHALRPRRGTDLDPMKGQRMARRERTRKRVRRSRACRRSKA